MLRPLPGLAKREDLKSAFAKKANAFDEKTITGGSAEALRLKLAGEVADGWRQVRIGKRTIRIAKDKPIDRQLEDDVWCLFYKMGFTELNVDRNFKLATVPDAPSRQLDVFAKDDDTVFIVECTHVSEEGPKSVKHLLDKIAGMREDAVRIIHAHYGKEPRLKIKFGIATRNIEWNAGDKIRAKHLGVSILTDDDLTYFSKLTDLLKAAARFQFLGRYLAGEKVEGIRVAVPATKGRAGGGHFYNFLISPHDLLRLSYISHKSKTSNDDLETYQRMVKPSRLAAIGRYLDDGGKFPTNIVVNFKVDGALRFDQGEKFGDTSTGTLHLPPVYGTGWIIDGQHRLYGYAHASRSPSEDKSVVSVLAYENLPIRDEIQMFVDINTQQVKVNRNLVNEILSTLDIADEDPRRRLDAMYARIALRMDEYSGSPIKNRVLTVAGERTHLRCLTLTSLADGLAENNLVGTIHRLGKGGAATINPGPLASLSPSSSVTMEKAVEALARYLNIFASELPDHWELGDAKGGYLCTNLGIRSLLLLLRKLVAFVEHESGVEARLLEPEDMISRLRLHLAPIVAYFKTADPNDVAAFRTRGSSLASVTQNCLHMMSIIHEARPAFAPPEVISYMNSRDLEGTKQAKDMIDEVNLVIFNDVIETLKEKYGTAKDAWWLKGVPEAVRNSCDQMFNRSNGELERWNYLFLANYPDILLHADNWDTFKHHYNFYGHGKKADLVRWIGRINKARTVTHHAEKGPLSRDEVDYVRHVRQLVLTYIKDGETVEAGKAYIAEKASKVAA